MIRTQWHELVEGAVKKVMAKHNGVAVPDEGDVDKVMLAELINIGTNAPKYFFERELIDALERPDCQSSVQAMHQHGIDRLPFKVCVAEFEGITKSNIGKTRNFVILSERSSVELLPSEERYHPYRAVLIHLVDLNGVRAVALPTMMAYLAFDDDADAGEGRTSFGCHYYSLIAPHIRANERTKRMALETRDRDVAIMFDALFATVLLLNTRGVIKEVNDLTQLARLNRARRKRDREPVPVHTVVRVGHVYDRSGNRVDRVSGYHQRVHWRPGYSATRWTGKGKTVAKRVFVEPYLVNYDPVAAEEAPTPSFQVKW